MSPQLHLSSVHALIEKIPAVENRRGFPKPGWAFWTSTLNENGKSGWVEWCESEDYGDPYSKNWFRLEVKPDARIFTINCLADLLDVLDLYPAPDYSGRPYQIDFERMAQDWDGLHLTEAGQWATRLTVPNLYGRDCESTCWFRWVFSSWEKVPAGSMAEVRRPQ